MFTADGKPSDDDPRENGPSLGDERATPAEAPGLEVTGDDPLNLHGSGGAAMSLREVLVGMIQEYARHLGHVDLLRERIDGRVGQ